MEFFLIIAIETYIMLWDRASYQEQSTKSVLGYTSDLSDLHGHQEGEQSCCPWQ